jgi:hypothetical protein
MTLTNLHENHTAAYPFDYATSIAASGARHEEKVGRERERERERALIDHSANSSASLFPETSVLV